jgi:hypothetical protein
VRTEQVDGEDPSDAGNENARNEKVSAKRQKQSKRVLGKVASAGANQKYKKLKSKNDI